jgi:hypothetical protein
MFKFIVKRQRLGYGLNYGLSLIFKYNVQRWYIGMD